MTVSGRRHEQDVANEDITALLGELGSGNQKAFETLMPLVYDELCELARIQRFRIGGRDMATSSLVHEAYLKLVGQDELDLESRGQFFYLASLTMRSVLVDNARAASRQKRGGQRKRVEMGEELLVSEQRGEELLALDRALTRLEREDERLGRIVACRFFGGLTVDETATALSVSPATIKRGWNLARAWLLRELRQPVAGL